MASGRCRSAVLFCLLAIAQALPGCKKASAVCKAYSAAKPGLLRTFQGLEADVFTFWLKYGLDRKFGGANGFVDNKGNVVKGWDGQVNSKYLVQTCRHLQYFSTYYSVRGRPAIAKLSAQSLRASLDKFLDKGTNLFSWAITQQGAVLDPIKNTYGNILAVYALATYGDIFQDKASKDQAVATFKAWDTKWHAAANKGWTEGGADAAAARGLGTHLQALEALATLHRVTKLDLAKTRLVEAVDVWSTKIIQASGNICSAGYSATWKCRSPTNNFGLSLEASWMLIEAVDYLKTVTPAYKDGPPRAAAIKAGNVAATYGYIPVAGGFYELGNLQLNPAGKVTGVAVTGNNRVWWAQTEGLLGTWRLLQASCDKALLDKFIAAVAATVKFQRDPKFGEFFDTVDLQGKVLSTYKGQPWKASYHTGRMPTLLIQWVKQFEAQCA